ncbi:hypothetical protein MJH12_18730, partial [bacterium]|nr:hypothetical protein [bacterium]
FYKSSESLVLSDGSNILVDLLTLGASGVSAFAGVDQGTNNEIGFNLKNADLALAFMKEKTGDKREWYSVKANVESADFTGSSHFDVEAKDIVVEINSAVNDIVVDFSKKQLAVNTSSDSSLKLDFLGSEGAMIRLRANLDLSVSNFFSIEGGFSFSKSTASITLSDNSTKTVDVLSLGADKVSAFIGLNGNSSDQIGFELNDMNFALAFFQDQSDKSLSWMSLYANALESNFVGSDDLTLSSSNLQIEINTADKNGLVVDFVKQSLTIQTSKTSSIELKMDGQKGEMIKASGTLNVQVSDFFTVNGSFAFEKSSTSLTLSDGKSVDVDLITLGASGVHAFAGINGGSSEAFGFDLTNASMALVIA